MKNEAQIYILKTEIKLTDKVGIISFIWAIIGFSLIIITENIRYILFPLLSLGVVTMFYYFEKQEKKALIRLMGDKV